MPSKARSVATFAVMAALAATSSVSAQGVETLGNRAAAMAAFVAVADDASAVVWNPAGLVSGPLFNLQLDLGRSTDHPDEAPGGAPAASRSGTVLVSLGTTPAGVAYYRLSSTSLELNPEVGSAVDRQNGRILVRRLVTSHLGVTVQQSLGDFLTLGATIKLVRGSVGATTVEASSWQAAFARTDAVEREGSTRGDVDAGAMFAAGRIRAGVVVRNITAPSFGDPNAPGGRASLERHGRVGIAWADRWPGIPATVVSVDADLTRVPHPMGERRDVAAGVERWLRGQRFGVRGGVRASTVGDARVMASVGGSFAVRAGAYADAFIARGADDAQSWGVAVRLTY